MKLKYLNITILVLTIAALFFELSRCGTSTGLMPGYPAWLVDGDYFPQQTSGMAYLGEKSPGKHVFITCDDKQAIHLLTISDGKFKIDSVKIDPSITDTLPQKVKFDFEDITWDKYTNKVYISIEPYSKYRQMFGIFELQFKNNDIFSREITGMKRLNITPDSLFRQNVKDNIAYEGLAVDENYFYLGLEGIARSEKEFDGGVIRVVDKKTLRIVASVLLDSLGINTVTGLATGNDGSLWGTDRNRLAFFNLKFDNKFRVTNVRVFSVSNYIPDYHAFRYAAAIESIAIDANGLVYLIDDPFTKEYVPVDNILRKLDSKTAQRFKDLVPIIYCYKLD